LPSKVGQAALLSALPLGQVGLLGGEERQHVFTEPGDGGRLQLDRSVKAFDGRLSRVPWWP
jgi:hypothetical protein